ncbi:feminizer [Methylobacterium sp. ME121]|nr:feminizer [Methylobacterium sp. ME121]
MGFWQWFWQLDAPFVRTRAGNLGPRPIDVRPRDPKEWRGRADGRRHLSPMRPDRTGRPT